MHKPEEKTIIEVAYDADVQAMSHLLHGYMIANAQRKYRVIDWNGFVHSLPKEFEASVPNFPQIDV